ncbi:hypothetical protein Hs30E_15670 [Lactococcus hodotermopsidis]|uniref:Uncharacterized protein n=1 Tax=Pseudolactococcus hodotermopsidis TaxID=2709157 RepID=A0A6A0BDY5_9LACT|nr:hypothetical protein Hs30E_15670 [Lactococcus hodotermopsidis]
MIYTNGKDSYLIYCYSDYRNTWKVENYPFDRTVRVLSERGKDNFIKNNKLKEVGNDN